MYTITQYFVNPLVATSPNIYPGIYYILLVFKNQLLEPLDLLELQYIIIAIRYPKLAASSYST